MAGCGKSVFEVKATGHCWVIDEPRIDHQRNACDILVDRQFQRACEISHFLTRELLAIAPEESTGCAMSAEDHRRTKDHTFEPIERVDLID